jgi:hypothetical protein
MPGARAAAGLQRGGRDTIVLAEQAKQYVLGPEVVVVHPPRLIQSEQDYGAGTLRKVTPGDT